MQKNCNDEHGDVLDGFLPSTNSKSNFLRRGKVYRPAESRNRVGERR